MSIRCLINSKAFVSRSSSQSFSSHRSKWSHFSSSSGNDEKSKASNTNSSGSNMKVIGIFAMGLYIGLCVFKDNKDSSKKEQSGIFKEMKENFEKSSGVR